ncbi:MULTISPECIES: DVU3141 family protein [unclassified Halomonas]|uniref:DVU3141 family protein n=1 Tax=unclassified Halomonas TaxID=2609666 RepID=UPI00288634CB|nr:MULTISPECIES: DVU3141 family protein [unclassified Halomonas]MDT0500423.1 DVU3141 family protein [Halomonas sp. PAR7]MDT0590032.1 DVU3141 family protein [Halomonas sp. PAR8]
MSNALLFTGDAKRWLIAMSLLAALSGCALQPGSGQLMAGGAVHGSQGKPLDANLSGFLEQAPPGAVTELPQSPWGPGAVVLAEAPYAAASGRVCRQLRVETSRGVVTPQVACESATGWEAKRLVTEVRSGGAR